MVVAKFSELYRQNNHYNSCSSNFLWTLFVLVFLLRFALPAIRLSAAVPLILWRARQDREALG